MESEQARQLVLLQLMQVPLTGESKASQLEQILGVLHCLQPLMLQAMHVELTSEKVAGHKLQTAAEVQVTQLGTVQLATQLPLTRE